LLSQKVLTGTVFGAGNFPQVEVLHAGPATSHSGNRLQAGSTSYEYIHASTDDDNSQRRFSRRATARKKLSIDKLVVEGVLFALAMNEQ
jgi:hypothetical protein